MENVFVVTDGSYGITETSAANLCAIASQVKAEAEQTIENVSFINNDINIIGSANENFMRISAGYTNTNDIQEALDVICKMNSFISWFAEARKQIEDYRVKFTQKKHLPIFVKKKILKSHCRLFIFLEYTIKTF